MRQGGLLFHRQYTLEMAEAGQLIRREIDLSAVEFKFRTAVSDKPRLERLQGSSRSWCARCCSWPTRRRWLLE